MQHFTPFQSLAGGLLIGVACAALWILGGRFAGMSGIAAGVFADPLGADGTREERSWRGLFLLGVLVGGALLAWLTPGAFAFTPQRSTASLVIAGLLVGVGTRLGGGCTSGHGVCGVGRGSRRSIVATVTFMLAGAATVLAIGQAGGAL